MDLDKILNNLHGNLNKKFKDTHQHTYLGMAGDGHVNVTRFTSTGCTPLDVAISNRTNGGIPHGKISVLEGLNSSGKSLLLGTILAENQKNGGISVLLDNEFANDPTFYAAIGMDMDRLVYSNIEYIEDMLAATEQIILDIRKEDADVPIVIGWDSVANAKSKAQGASDYNKDGYATEKAIILSQKLPKLQPFLAKHNVALVATQQLRAKMDAMAFGDKYTSASGGMALGFSARVIVRLTNMGKIQTALGSTKLVVGTRNLATVTKNHIGPPYRKAEFEVYFDSGIDDSKACLDILKFYNVVKSAGAWSKWKEDLGLPGVDMEKNFQMAEWREWLSNPEFKQKVAEKIAELSTMKYKGFMEDDNTTIVDENDSEVNLEETKELLND